MGRLLDGMGQSSGVPLDMDSWSTSLDMDSSCGVPMAMGSWSDVPMDMDSWSASLDMDSSCGVPMAMGSSFGMFAPSVGFLRVLLVSCVLVRHGGYLHIPPACLMLVSLWSTLASPARSTQVTPGAVTNTMRTRPQGRQRTTVPGARR
jgi:hypothetical protein